MFVWRSHYPFIRCMLNFVLVCDYSKSIVKSLETVSFPYVFIVDTIINVDTVYCINRKRLRFLFYSVLII